jgi:hypothetical protein
MRALPVFLAATIVVALSGCADTANAAPCQDFESVYNSVDPESKLNSNIRTDQGDGYSAALNRLSDIISSDAHNVAKGEVKKTMTEVVDGVVRYNYSLRPRRDVENNKTPLEARNMIYDAITGVVKACKDDGHQIALKGYPTP